MSAEATLTTTLDGDAGVGAICGDRIYPMLLPQNPTLPAVTYQVINYEHHASLDGDTSGLDRVYMQIDCWARTYAEAKSLASAVRTALKSITSSPITQRDGVEDANDTRRVSIDAFIWD